MFIADIISTLDWWGAIISPKPELKLDSFFRKEANVITHYCFRNTHLESIHAGSVPFNDNTMKRLMLESCGKMCEWMKFRDALNVDDEGSDIYIFLISIYHSIHIKQWITDEEVAAFELEKLKVKTS